MPRIRSLNILLDGSQEGNAYLSELYGRVIENVTLNAVSSYVKNNDLSGDPESGSMEATRFGASKSKPYGTARSAGRGDALKAAQVPVQIDQDREIVEELENKDVRLYGVDGVLDRRSLQHVTSMVSELDTAFFAKAIEEGTEFTPESALIEDQVEEAIQDVESTKNDYVDGVPREFISVIANPKVYGGIRKYLQTVTRPNVDSTQDEFEAFNGARVFKSVHLPNTCAFCVMVDGSIAQPVTSDVYSATRVPQSNAVSVDLFYSYGTKAVTPELIKYVGTTTSGTGGEGTTP